VAGQPASRSFSLPANLPSSFVAPRYSPPVLYQNVPQMISGGGRECQWSVGRNGKRHDCPEDRSVRSCLCKACRPGVVFSTWRALFPFPGAFPFSFPRRGGRAYVYCALRTTTKHLSPSPPVLRLHTLLAEAQRNHPRGKLSSLEESNCQKRGEKKSHKVRGCAFETSLDE
jgi:hypothetical protein